MHLFFCTQFVLLLAVCNVVQSSSAGFRISAVGQSLVETDQSDEIPTYTLQMKVGQTITLVSQGIVMPRGRPSQPSKPDEGAWSFDPSIFQVVSYDENQFDETQIPIALKALKIAPENTSVRFVGNILGYDRKYNVLVEIIN